ncbi:MAG: hypothetical protein U0K83_00915, partial [Bacteroidales bacterium]|nr:hypothetical protein [Bacteroidales bacterium]
MKRIVFFLCTLLCANVLLAQSFFTIGDLTYHVISPTKVEVMKCDTSATSVAIPETVIHEGITYTVHKIGDYQIVSLWIDKGGFGYGGACYIKEKGLFSKWHKICKVPCSCEWISETQFT